ncbi:MAG: hypothetical protein A2Y76_07345 [Planctomycetes bacterium RBG_13_60_9]|nr:MAG: hypothetical protein A2Y76_07345 [Planctomycetes bacterium RBG_13_60_9]
MITDGPYRFSCNPAYVALTLWYLGAALILDSGCVLPLVLPPLLITHFRVIRREERHLEARFGEPYLRYKSHVRRWL